MTVRLITLDFETFYSKDYSLSKLSTEEYVRHPSFEVIGVSVKVNNETPEWFSGTMEETKAWLGAFDIPNAFLIAHHTQFDAFILNHHFGIRPKFYLCTMSMARPLHGQTIGVSLKALADKYTIGMKGDEVVRGLGKRRLDFAPEELARYGQYCCNDVQLAYILFHVLKKDLPAGEIRVIDLIIRMFVEPVLELDTDLLVDYRDKLRVKKEELLATVASVAGADVLRSNPKFAVLLQQLGVVPPMKPSPTNPDKQTFAFSKTDVEFKELLQHEDPRVQAVVSARLGVRSTIEETRTESFLGIASRGPWPVYLNYYGANGTGRASGGDGVNPQNLPRGGTLRKAALAPEGHVLLAPDSSNIEARVLAWLAGQDDLVEDFRQGVDVYSKFAGEEVYSRPITKADVPERFLGKTCILGLGYGTGGPKLQHTLAVAKTPVQIKLSDAYSIVSAYRRRYSRIEKIWDVADFAINAIIRGERFTFGRNDLLYTSEAGIHLPNGMVIRYPGLFKHLGQYAYASNRRQQAEWTRQRLSGEYDVAKLTHLYGAKVIENVVQALARIVVFDQMLLISERYRTVLTVHDEVVACVPEGLADEAREVMMSIMGTAPVWAPDLPVACEIGVGRTYGDAK